MLNVSREEALERWDSLPEKIREALFSEENFDLLEKLGDKYLLPKKALTELSIGTSNVLHGFASQDDLRRELSSADGFSNDIALKICSEIKVKIFDPLEPELSSIYKPAVGPKPAITNQTPTTQSELTPPEKISPTKEEAIKYVASETPPVNVAPFILHKHEEEELKPRAEEVISTGSPIRPTFYKAPNSTTTKESGYLSSKPIKARLELGIEEERHTTKTKSLKTKPEGARLVNYSEFRTKLDDPFSAQIKTGSDKAENNDGVDKKGEAKLKDLPL